jgi:CTP:molybdopterin cytidylyltransferase MocA
MDAARAQNAQILLVQADCAAELWDIDTRQALRRAQAALIAAGGP